MVSFHSVSPTAAYLLVPYFGWSLYATGLTFAIYKKNPRVKACAQSTAMLLIMQEASPCVNLQHCMPSSLPYMLLSLPAFGPYHLKGAARGLSAVRTAYYGQDRRRRSGNQQ